MKKFFPQILKIVFILLDIALIGLFIIFVLPIEEAHILWRLVAVAGMLFTVVLEWKALGHTKIRQASPRELWLHCAFFSFRLVATLIAFVVALAHASFAY